MYGKDNIEQTIKFWTLLGIQDLHSIDFALKNSDENMSQLAGFVWLHSHRITHNNVHVFYLLTLVQIVKNFELCIAGLIGRTQKKLPTCNQFLVNLNWFN